MYRILMIEDDKGITEALTVHFSKWGMESRGIHDFRNVMEEYTHYDPHLVLIDIALPFFDGYHWCREIRKDTRTPIIFISSAGDNMNQIMAMQMGADDFIAKPFDGSVLIAKVQALLRRTYDYADNASLMEFRNLRLDIGAQCVMLDDQALNLTKNEYRILYTLMLHRGQVVTRAQLMDALWQTDSFVDDNTLTVNVNRLRAKLREASEVDYIETKFGVGYLLKEEPQ